MKNQVLYSPLPPEQYSRPCRDLGRAGVGAELAGEDLRPFWNLYWLSDPGIDCFTRGWDGGLRVDLKMLRACGRALEQMLDGHSVQDLLGECTPQQFVDHVLASDHRHLAPYRLARSKWLRTIRVRASLYRGALKQEGTVVYAQFGQRPNQASVTTAGQSAIIMPLAFRKS